MAFVAFVRKFSRATQDLWSLQKQQVLKDIPKEDILITEPEVNESDENKREAEERCSQ